MGTMMKALRSFGTEQRVKRGEEFDAGSEARASELEKGGLAERLKEEKPDDPPPAAKVETPPSNKMEPAPANKMEPAPANKMETVPKRKAPGIGKSAPSKKPATKKPKAKTRR